MSDPTTLGDDLVLNGIDATTGRLLVDSVSVDQVVRAAKHLPPAAEAVEERTRRSFGVELLGGPQLDQLDQAGWGVIWAQDAPASLREALAPLLALRRQQAGDGHYHEFSGADGYTPSETPLTFRARHQQGPGTPDPEKVPYYLLLVGGPESIPFEFQYGLDLNHFVGRIAFGTTEEYERYAKTVVSAERGELRRPRTVAFFGPQNTGDRATRLSSERLVAPLAKHAADSGLFTAVVNRSKSEATKAALAGLIASGSAPGVLFTASHGIAFPSGDALQPRRQGALLCQDWTPSALGPLSPDVYFSADDVADDADVAGMVAMHFACYGAGTPAHDNFSAYIGGQNVLAPVPFVGALPQRLLGHPKGGALAVIGHVDRAWGFSFGWPGVDDDTATFAMFLKQLGQNLPVGFAMQRFNERYIDLGGALTDMLQTVPGTPPPPDRDVAWAWVSSNDARNYVLLGDPAVRLPQPPQ